MLEFLHNYYITLLQLSQNVHSYIIYFFETCENCKLRIHVVRNFPMQYYSIHYVLLSLYVKCKSLNISVHKVWN